MLSLSRKLTLFLCFLAIAVIYTGCSSDESSDSLTTSEKIIQEGKELAQTHCGSCHLPTPASMLDKETWLNNVLPIMAPKLGIGVWRQNQYHPTGNSTVSYEEWMKIVNYFKQEAPETLEAADPPVPLQKGNSLFSFEKPDSTEFPNEIASTTLVKFEPNSGNFYSSDANENALIRWNKNLESKKVLSFSYPAVDLNFLDDRSAIVTTIGTMKAEDISRGIVQNISLEDDTVRSNQIIATELTRPVKTLGADFNKDGRDDWLVCVFGHDTGGLYIFQQKPDGSFIKKTLRSVPGAEDAVVDDFNGDGWPDVMVLFGYDNEGIWMFTNDKEGGFKTKNLLQFSPVFGSTSFEWVDFNGDGLKDIMLTNGDNADFSPILKPYHGLRIYLNQGEDKFEQAYFYPINGTTKAIAKDFDLDGDLDIVTIAYFADLENNLEESFIFFERKDGLQFTPHTIPIFEQGRWIDMDVADYDNDGDPDVVLGNFSRRFMGEEDFEPTWDTKTPILLLTNQTR